MREPLKWISKSHDAFVLPLPTASERSHDLVALGVVVMSDGDRSGIEGNLYVGLTDLDLG